MRNAEQLIGLRRPIGCFRVCWRRGPEIEVSVLQYCRKMQASNLILFTKAFEPMLLFLAYWRGTTISCNSVSLVDAFKYMLLFLVTWRGRMTWRLLKQKYRVDWCNLCSLSILFWYSWYLCVSTIVYVVYSKIPRASVSWHLKIHVSALGVWDWSVVCTYVQSTKATM